MSLFLANCGAGKPAGAASDADATAFLTAAGITDPTISSAIHALVISLKSAGIWSKCIAIYPFVGGDATKHSYNLKNTAAYQITWSGTVTHNANGVTGDGSTGYGNTGINANSVLTNADCHASLYTRTSSSGNEQVAGLSIRDGGGSNRAFEFNPRRVSSATFRTGDVTLSGGNVNCQGFCIGTRRSTSDTEIYRNGSSLATSTTTQTSTHLGNGNVYLSAMNFVGIGVFEFSSRNHAFASLGNGLTDTEVADYYTAVQAFQTTLGRQV